MMDLTDDHMEHLTDHMEQLERIRQDSRKRSGSLRMAAARGDWDEFEGIARGTENGGDCDRRSKDEPRGDDPEGDGSA